MNREKFLDLQARKELLMARAAIERLELSAQLHQVKEAATPAALAQAAAQAVLPGLTRGGVLPTAFRVWNLVRGHPIASSLGSMLLTRVAPSSLLRATKLGLIGLAAYQGYRLFSDYRKTRARRKAADSATPASEAATPEDPASEA